MNKIKDKRIINKVTHCVRRNQAVLQYGVGAMIDFPGQVLMTGMPETWDNPEIIHDERLEKLLGVKYFITPSDAGIAFVRFPKWYFCPKCRRFQPLEQWQKENAEKVRLKGWGDEYMLGKLRCSRDNQELVPARIVSVCECGHIDDFPWVNWVHRKNKGYEKPVCSNPQLLFKTGTSATSGLEGIEIECTNCGAKATLFGAFYKEAFEEAEKTSKYKTSFSCTGRHPWKNEKEVCFEFPRAKQRGASSVYFPRIVSSLVIPPYSNILTIKVENSANFTTLSETIKDGLEDCNTEQEKTELINKKTEKYAKKIADEINGPEEAVSLILNRKFLTEKENEQADKELKYKAEEYRALTGFVKSGIFDEGDFKREEIDVSLYHIKGLKSVALIHKVKEVTALIGFSRIQPTHSMDESDGRFVSIKHKDSDFYPATVSKGEGIFIEFDRHLLEVFFNKKIFNERAKTLEKKYKESFLGMDSNIIIDSEFVFMHTLSHLLIKELSFSCGYPTASIRERIYYGKVGEAEMCGIFIYTTGGDSEGTLGGLVRQGYPDCLPRVFKTALEKARFCANDPVCSYSDGQGLAGINYAACHACTLLPETSCEYANVLLDRVLLIGNMDGSISGFYTE